MDGRLPISKSSFFYSNVFRLLMTVVFAILRATFNSASQLRFQNLTYRLKKENDTENLVLPTIAMSNNIRIKQVDAFTTKPFTGNPAGVVVDASHLSSATMQHIAREMNLSETVYVLPAEDDEENDLRLRWFTPTQEVDLCGHATIAAFHALAEEGLYGLEPGEPQSFVVETRSGNLVVDVEWKNYRPYLKFSLPIPEFFPYPGDISLLCGALGISDVELSQRVKPLITGNGYCYIPAKNYDSLDTAEPNRTLLARLNEQFDLKGFALLTTDTNEQNADWVLRFFAPELGVFEDPVTGSANGPAAAYLWESGLLPKDQRYFTFRAEQGHWVGRTGQVDVLMSVNEKGEIEELQICGSAITVMEATMITSATQSEAF
jgi:trans-2,3-dihydro-3-hydroxyanthranilate isomerase